MLQHESYSYLRDQRKQKAQVDKLEKAYVGLAKSQGELSLSHRNMKKQEKMQDKFFTRMWKGVKGLWKVLNANKPLLTFRPNEDGDDVATWSDDGGDKDSEAIKTYEED